MASHLIGYQSGRGFFYQLSGASKLIFFVLVSIACMTTYGYAFDSRDWNCFPCFV